MNHIDDAALQVPFDKFMNRRHIRSRMYIQNLCKKEHHITYRLVMKRRCRAVKRTQYLLA